MTIQPFSENLNPLYLKLTHYENIELPVPVTPQEGEALQSANQATKIIKRLLIPDEYLLTSPALCLHQISLTKNRRIGLGIVAIAAATALLTLTIFITLTATGTLSFSLPLVTPLVRISMKLGIGGTIALFLGATLINMLSLALFYKGLKNIYKTCTEGKFARLANELSLDCVTTPLDTSKSDSVKAFLHTLDMTLPNNKRLPHSLVSARNKLIDNTFEAHQGPYGPEWETEILSFIKNLHVRDRAYA